MDIESFRDIVVSALEKQPEVTKLSRTGRQINVFFGDIEYELVIRTTLTSKFVSDTTVPQTENKVAECHRCGASNKDEDIYESGCDSCLGHKLWVD